jgi:putative radical SAM enzyme (TIGR03279 family)
VASPASPHPSPPTIASVRPGSRAAAAGLAAGDRVLRVNGRAPRDYIEYRFLIADECVLLTVETAEGGGRRVRVEKAIDEDLGIVFTSDVFDGVRTCQNRCGFCFVAQLPAGMRPALYVRDDDYRLSFLHGNFITLTNLRPQDRRRIARDHLSPLYVSVQATEPEVRARLFGRDTPDPLAEMRRLMARGIEFHTQIVVCPGINDGVHLTRTVEDLAALHPGVQSIGIVPVGLTRHRRRLPEIPAVTPEIAAEILTQVARWQRGFRERLGTRLVFASDEMYLRAGRPIPSRASYEEFPQLGNGVGCVRLFLDDLKQMRPVDLRRPARVTLVTGEQAAELVRALARKLEIGQNVRAQVCIVPNRFFGESVTTAGLLTGGDIIAALQRAGAGDVVILPATAVREGEGFLDGVTVEEVARAIGAPVLVAAGPRDAAAAVREWDRVKGARDERL